MIFKKMESGYKFPCHPQEMFNKSPKKLHESARLLRIYMLQTIFILSQKYTQKELDDKILIDVENNKIIGIDLSRLEGFNCCVSYRYFSSKIHKTCFCEFLFLTLK